MFLERFAVFTLQLRAKFQSFLIFLVQEINAQFGQIFFVTCLFLLTGLLYYAWAIPLGLWLKIIFSLVYLLCFLLCVSAIHFILRRKRIRNNSGTLEVYTIDGQKPGEFQHFNLSSIPLTKDQAFAIFNAFSGKYLSGTYQSFEALIQLQPVLKKVRLEWIDTSPKRPELVNRQTLLEFLSQLLVGFENLENHQIMELVDHYFILKKSVGSRHTLSTKNISDWRTNKAAYLKEISRLFQHNL